MATDIIIWVVILAFVGAIILIMAFRPKKIGEERLREDVHNVLGDRRFERLFDKEELKRLLEQRKLTDIEKEEINELVGAIKRGDIHKAFELDKRIKQIATQTERTAGENVKLIKNEIRKMLEIEAELRMLENSGHDVSKIIESIRQKIGIKAEELRLSGIEERLQNEIVGELSVYQGDYYKKLNLDKIKRNLDNLVIRAAKIINKEIIIENKKWRAV
jgi:hypothetical protein